PRQPNKRSCISPLDEFSVIFLGKCILSRSNPNGSDKVMHSFHYLTGSLFGSGAFWPNGFLFSLIRIALFGFARAFPCLPTRGIAWLPSEEQDPDRYVLRPRWRESASAGR
ncbi:MAG: hypothetical protein WB608_24075, partial [Terracidiphilus sp.]